MLARGPLRSAAILVKVSSHVASLRTHRCRPDGRPQCEPFEYQDQASVPARAVARDPAVGRAGPGSYRLRITNAALRTLDFRGGLDPFLLKASDDELSPKALKIKRQLKAKLAEQAAA